MPPPSSKWVSLTEAEVYLIGPEARRKADHVIFFHTLICQRIIESSPGTSPAKHTTSSTPASTHLHSPYLPRDTVATTSYKTLLSCFDRSLITRQSATATKTQRTVASDLLIPQVSVPASEVGVAQSELLSKALVGRTSTNLG